MAWVALQDFNETSNGNLSGNTGGSGWSVGWAGAGTTNLNTSEFQVDTVAPSEGVRSVHVDCASVSAYIERLLTTAVTAGTVYMQVRCAQTNKVLILNLNKTTGSNTMLVKFDSDGNIKYYNDTSGAYVTIQAYSADTYYTVAFDFDTVAQANKYRVKINAGTYSSYVVVNAGTFSSITAVSFEHAASSGADFYIDYITTSDPYVINTPAVLEGTFALLTSSVVNQVPVSVLSLTGALLASTPYLSAVVTNETKNTSTWVNETKT